MSKNNFQINSLFSQILENQPNNNETKNNRETISTEPCYNSYNILPFLRQGKQSIASSSSLKSSLKSSSWPSILHRIITGIHKSLSSSSASGSGSHENGRHPPSSSSSSAHHYKYHYISGEWDKDIGIDLRGEDSPVSASRRLYIICKNISIALALLFMINKVLRTISRVLRPRRLSHRSDTSSPVHSTCHPVLGMRTPCGRWIAYQIHWFNKNHKTNKSNDEFKTKIENHNVIFYFHSFASSRIELPPFPSNLLSDDSSPVCIITVDRPGLGCSDPIHHHIHLSQGPNLSNSSSSSSSESLSSSYVTQFAQDIQYLAESLHIRKYAVIGHGAGGPFALACAAMFPQHVGAATLINTQVPLNTPQNDVPPHLLSQVQKDRQFLVKRNRLLRQLYCFLTYCRPLFSSPPRAPQEIALAVEEFYRRQGNQHSDIECSQALISSMREGLSRYGTKAAEVEMTAILSSWGFTLDSIDTVPVTLIHDTDNHIVPLECARWFSNHIPTAEFVQVSEGGILAIWRSSVWSQALAFNLKNLS
eukprot:gb/GECH01002295.1/.p1 GENE.gb/GECH01002295.1/~~gb/GECH01002295.1/.p1  ORF type:complete len:534 (+),score=104.57 gb/GECH01002295.1/:1-1602(+)